MEPIITLLTDFGESDGYVGAMKGVMLNIAPNARLIDISHAVAPQNIRQAARILRTVIPYYPPGTVHLVVVDPGVGSERNPIAVETPAGFFVGPDNGVLTPALEAAERFTAVALNNTAFWLEENTSHTFHGRDIFSPVAAHLAAGAPLSAVGSPLEDVRRMSFPVPKVDQTAIRGEVIYIDRFGNVQTNIAPLTWKDPHTLVYEGEKPMRFNTEEVRVTCGWHYIDGVLRRYSEVPIGERLALVGSNGELEIAINQGSAAEQMGLAIGDAVTLHLT